MHSGQLRAQASATGNHITDLVSSDCHKGPWSEHEQIKQQKTTFSWFWRQEVQDQVVSCTGFF
jgi:hypothetical protein